ncbi:hypothetical protein ACC675_37440, partial [Rhizobium ruizarguesonis]
VEIAHLPYDVSHAFAKDLLRTIQEQCKSSRYYRNKVVSFESDDFSGTHETMRVHYLHAVSRNDVVPAQNAPLHEQGGRRQHNALA